MKVRQLDAMQPKMDYWSYLIGDAWVVISDVNIHSKLCKQLKPLARVLEKDVGVLIRL